MSEMTRQVVLSTSTVGQLCALLEQCHIFLSGSDRAEVALVEYCQTGTGVTAHGLVEELAWMALRLRLHLDQEGHS